MTDGATNAGNIYQGDFDTFMSTSTQDTCTLCGLSTVVYSSAHFAPWIRLLSPTGVLLGNSSTQTGASNIAATAPTSGSYTVIIEIGRAACRERMESSVVTLAKEKDEEEVS